MSWTYRDNEHLARGQKIKLALSIALVLIACAVSYVRFGTLP